MLETALPFALAGLVGFAHAFEADHLVAVGNIVTKRERGILAIKDGIFWGLGHSSTIILIGIILILGKATFPEGTFGVLEGFVGVMLIMLGLVRMRKAYKHKGHRHDLVDHSEEHRLAYGVGLVHGLAGSGAMVFWVMTEFHSSLGGLFYLVIFGLGSVVGMLLAAGIFSLPFSKRFSSNTRLQTALVYFSAFLCLVIGVSILFEQFSA
ncbi:MAG: urease accessory protein [Bacteroidota bacterium]